MYLVRQERMEPPWCQPDASHGPVAGGDVPTPGKSPWLQRCCLSGRAPGAAWGVAEPRKQEG